MPRIGQLDSRISFSQREVDASGVRQGDWGQPLTVWAQLTWLRGGEAVLDQRLAGRQPVVITIREFAAVRSIDNSWRAVNAHNLAQVFDIKSAAPSREAGFLDILAEMVRGE